MLLNQEEFLFSVSLSKRLLLVVSLVWWKGALS